VRTRGIEGQDREMGKGEGGRRKEEGGRRKERRKEEGGRRKGRRKEEGGRRKEEGGRRRRKTYSTNSPQFHPLHLELRSLCRLPPQVRKDHHVHHKYGIWTPRVLFFGATEGRHAGRGFSVAGRFYACECFKYGEGGLERKEVRGNEEGERKERKERKER
jgi:hypothetical protein